MPHPGLEPETQKGIPKRTCFNGLDSRRCKSQQGPSSPITPAQAATFGSDPWIPCIIVYDKKIPGNDSGALDKGTVTATVTAPLFLSLMTNFDV